MEEKMEGEQNREKKRVTPRKGPSAKKKSPEQAGTGDLHLGRDRADSHSSSRQPGKMKKKKISTRWHPLLFVSSSMFSVRWSVEKLPRGKSAFQLLPQQIPLLLGSPHEASVLLGSPRQVGHHLVHRPIGDILIDREARLAWGWGGRDEIKNNSERRHDMDEDAKCWWIRIILFSCTNILID